MNEQAKIGILGGGQLGRMLLQPAIDLNLQLHFLDPDPEAPCASCSPFFTVGKLTDYDTVYQFAKNLDIISIEIENVNTEALAQLTKEGKQVYPQPEIIKIIQDKRLQKQFYQNHQIPTSPFVLIDEPAALEQYKDWLPAVLKLGKEGYDGKGVMLLHNEQDFKSAFVAPSVLERKIDIDKELAVIVARNPQGEIQAFPAVEMVFNPRYNLIDYQLSPARISEATAQKAQQLATKVIETFAMIGILAIEMFLDTEGNLWVNEVAPRPHNSGHQSIEANYTSQFEQHLRAINHMPLGNTDLREQAAMVNLIGEEGYQGIARYQGWEKISTLKGVKIHLYGKKYTKPGRKMGHITILENNLQALKEKVQYIKENFKVIA
ncbi:MAG: 5-(carboxyamino)imidazole ribonucleotide synthase [Cytophagales bacterium]|nr:MAG: 5-(carboxyamino)imidazole ribonucleotide synthase [Cytophagales bacterium]